MLTVFRRGQVRRLSLLTAGVLALVLSGTSGVTAAAATAPATPAGGGWVATPAAVHAAQLKLTVPTVRCATKKSATVAVGLFGTTTTGSQSAPWQLTVLASCHHAKTTYRGVAIDASGHYTVLRLHAGDRVRLLESAALTYEIDDYTTHSGAGGGSAIAGGQQPVLGTPVLFGARVTGHVSGSVDVHVSLARINRHALNTVPRHRQPQVVAGHRVVRSSTLGEGGAFTLTIA